MDGGTLTDLGVPCRAKGGKLVHTVTTIGRAGGDMSVGSTELKQT